MKLSVLMPVYDEAATLSEIVAAVFAVADELGFDELELVAVDDGSDDGSGEILDELARDEPRLRVFRHPENRGKGAAVRRALAEATGDVVVVQDADLECRPEDLPSLLAPLVEGRATVVFGSRFRPHGAPPGTGFHQVWFNRILSFMFRRASGQDLSDVAVCHKAFPAALGRELGLVSRGFTIDAELAIKLARRGVTIVEVPVTYRPRRTSEGKKMKVFDGCRALATMAVYWLFGVDRSR